MDVSWPTDAITTAGRYYLFLHLGTTYLTYHVQELFSVIAL